MNHEKILEVSDSRPGIIYNFLATVGECTLLLVNTFRRLFSKPFEGKEILQQMGFVGVNSIPIILITNLFSGGVIALYSTEFMLRYGVTALAGGSVGLTCAREIAPVLAGIMVAARCGTSMTAQIGTMVVTEQIDAMKSLNVNPINYLVVPRVIACLFMLPILCLLGAYTGIFGGYLVSILKGISSGSYIDSLQHFLKPWDFIAAMYKSIIFGGIVGIVACQQGLNVVHGAKGVGQATTRTVVISMVMIYFLNYFLSSWLY